MKSENLMVCSPFTFWGTFLWQGLASSNPTEAWRFGRFVPKKYYSTFIEGRKDIYMKYSQLGVVFFSPKLLLLHFSNPNNQIYPNIFTSFCLSSSQVSLFHLLNLSKISSAALSPSSKAPWAKLAFVGCVASPANSSCF